MKYTIKEFYAGGNKKTQDVVLSIVTDKDEKIDFDVNRDIAIGMIEQIFCALDVKGIHKPKNFN